MPPAIGRGAICDIRGDREMFGLGLIEIGIVLLLGWLAFKKVIARRYPGISRAFTFVLFGTALLMLLFALLTQIR